MEGKYTRQDIVDWIRQCDGDKQVRERTITYYGQQGFIDPPESNRYSYHVLCQVRAIRALGLAGMELAEAANLVRQLSSEELMAKAEQTLAAKTLTARLPTATETLPRNLLYTSREAGHPQSFGVALPERSARSMGQSARVPDDELRVIAVAPGLSLIMDQQYARHEESLIKAVLAELTRIKTTE